MIHARQGPSYFVTLFVSYPHNDNEELHFFLLIEGSLNLIDVASVHSY